MKGFGSEGRGGGGNWLILVYSRHKADLRFESPCDIQFVLRKETFHHFFFFNIIQFFLRTKL